MEKMSEAVNRFIKSVQPFLAAYEDPKLSFVAIRQDDGYHVVKSRLYLTAPMTDKIMPEFRSPSLKAGQFRLSSTGLNLREFLDKAAQGKITTPDDEILFDHPDAANCEVIPFHPEGIENQYRLSVLTAKGSDQREYFRHPDIDWELKASNPPFDSLAELMTTYGVGFPMQHGALFEVIGAEVAMLDFGSKIDGTVAKVTIRVNRNFDYHKITLGIRVFNGTLLERRHMFDATSLSWSHEDAIQLGSIEFDVPEAALVQCYVSYDGYAVHTRWIFDLTLSPNPRRTLVESLDTKLSLTHELLTAEPRKGSTGKSGDLEIGVAWLLWLLGFSVIHLGATQRMSEAVDVVAVTPTGHYAFIECTTGHLKADHKLSSLVARTEDIRAKLDKNGIRNVRAISVIVTSRLRVFVKADLEQAEKLGVLVISREDLERALEDRTRQQPDADKIFMEAEEYIASRLSSKT